MHEYPLRDLPYVEDLGRKARRFTVQGFVLGDDYMAARDALMAACEEAGPGTLVHPYLGVLEVTCQGCTVRESTKEGGQATFSLTFQEAGKRNYPAQTTDFTEQAADQAAETRTVAGDVFRKLYEAVGPSWLAAVAAGEVKAAIAMVRTVVQAMPSPIADSEEVAEFLEGLNKASEIVDATLASDPTGLEEVISQALEGLSGVTGIDGALEITRFGYTTGSESASAYGGDLESIAQTTANRVLQADNREVLAALVRRLAASSGVEAALGTEYPSYEEAARARDSVLGRLDELVLEAGDSGDDRGYEALRRLYASTAKAFHAKGAVLPHLDTVTVGAGPTPTLLLAYDLYENLGRADEIAVRNRVRHPGMPPGGEILWVLDA